VISCNPLPMDGGTDMAEDHKEPDTMKPGHEAEFLKECARKAGAQVDPLPTAEDLKQKAEREATKPKP
jgi:hypothetical protein